MRKAIPVLAVLAVLAVGGCGENLRAECLRSGGRVVSHVESRTELRSHTQGGKVLARSRNVLYRVYECKRDGRTVSRWEVRAS